MPLSESSFFPAKSFSVPLLEWHSLHARVLPWMTKDPYDVWLSEVMLQQTQVSTVLERYAFFQRCFPTIRSLGAASVEDVLAQWSGLGYYRRARNLHACAQTLVNWLDLHGDWPKEASEWMSFPGVGRSTANAIVSACFNKVVPILDANAKRVLLRFAGDLQASDKQAWVYAHDAMAVNAAQAASYTQAMMDLGSAVCTARKADCLRCPLMANCKSAGWEIKKVLPSDNIVDGKTTVTKLVKSSKPVVPFEWALCVRNEGKEAEVLLQQRDESSFWPALWVLPALSARFVPIVDAVALTLKHELSHRSLRIEAQRAVLRGDIQSNERWVLLSDIAERKIPVPTPIAVLVQKQI